VECSGRKAIECSDNRHGFGLGEIARLAVNLVIDELVHGK
jgi:hypothetical protein